MAKVPPDLACLRQILENQADYRRFTAEALTYLEWLKRLAPAQAEQERVREAPNGAADAA